MAADAFIVGMDGMALLEDRDAFHVGVRSKVVEVALRRSDERDHRLAEMIANEVIKRIK